jgi:site-specific DNA recombinase
MLSVAFGQAKYYTDNLRENILRGIRQKLRRGVLSGKAPLGYYNHPRTRTIEPDPKTFEKVREVLELFSTGAQSLSSIQRMMTDAGLVGARSGKPLPYSSIGGILANPFYYGAFKYRGEIHEGSHKAMISKRCFDDIQAVLARRARPRRREDEGFVFVGFATCGECGYAISSEQHVKKSGLRFGYYRCSKRSKRQKCTQRYVRQEDLAEQVKEQVALCILPDEWKEKFLEKIQSWKQEALSLSASTIEALRTDLERTRTKLDRLTDLFLDEQIDRPAFLQKKNALMGIKADLEQKIAEVDRNGNRWFELTRTWILKANTAQTLASHESSSERKNFLMEVGSNREIRDGHLAVSFKKPWNSLAETNLRAQRAFPKNLRSEDWWSLGDSNP